MRKKEQGRKTESEHTHAERKRKTQRGEQAERLNAIPSLLPSTKEKANRNNYFRMQSCTMTIQQRKSKRRERTERLQDTKHKKNTT
mmetsp:Transcript_5580/g.11054  ORF Transcript_5580/g.11054 Transcript_5580/m.11054 type:complete len:86 (-) Transcript_5580:725-982(-)